MFKRKWLYRWAKQAFIYSYNPKHNRMNIINKISINFTSFLRTLSVFHLNLSHFWVKNVPQSFKSYCLIKFIVDFFNNFKTAKYLHLLISRNSIIEIFILLTLSSINIYLMLNSLFFLRYIKCLWFHNWRFNLYILIYFPTNWMFLFLFSNIHLMFQKLSINLWSY